MVNMNWKAIMTTVFCVFLTNACSKQLMPPEVQTSGNASDETEFTASTSDKDLGNSGGSAGGFFSEEPMLENGSKGSDFNGIAGNGSTSNPFNSSNQGAWDPKGSASSGSGNSEFGSSGSGSSDNIQESRLQDFQVSESLKDIHFKFDKYDLDGNSRTILKENAKYLKSKPGLHVEIQGHCDERGTNNYNIALGERRAQSTKQYLVSQGVDSSNVHVISFGEEKPFCFESGESCWYQNRRAHFMVSK
jgi:peptidoglycan-associated lipoprotein